MKLRKEKGREEMAKIIVAEDDVNLNTLYSKTLSLNGYEVTSCFNGREVLDALAQQTFDLVITDVMMPVMDGFTLAKELRRAGWQLPILMITVREAFEDKRQGFKNGVDDYMVKPVDVDEMLLRVEALLRRAQIVADNLLTVGNTTLDSQKLSLTVEGTTRYLRQKEFQLLFKLMSYPGKIFTRAQLMDDIWGYDSESDDRTVDVHIKRLRDLLGEDAAITIQTVRGLGYKGVKKA